MKLRVIFWAILGSVLSVLLLWQNTRRYPTEPVKWRMGKSAIELVILLLSALWLPIVLVSWCCVWLTRPIKTNWIKATIGVLAGVSLSFMGLYVLELLLLIGVLSIDEITGDREGFLHNLYRARRAAALSA
jgi:hypothetical protein